MAGAKRQMTSSHRFESRLFFHYEGSSSISTLNDWKRASPNSSFRLQQWLQSLPHRLGDDLLPGGSRMDLIRLVETSIAANALEQKRDEHCSILRRQVGE